MKIISTAGHIDHGKTSLIAAISGYWGDQNANEKERGITIDLSFSDYKGISFIDVPGHEQLLKTMLKGLSAELAMLVVDINEGLMPQSYEHAFALKILGTKHIILVLNKCDLCSDKATKAKNIEQELKEFGLNIKKTFLVSAKSKEGIKELSEYLLNLDEPSIQTSEQTRLYVDRLFNIKGAGLVATGFLASGELKAGQYYALNEGVLIKSLQAQHTQIDSIKAPARAAFMYKGKLEANSVISQKGALKSSKQLYVSAIYAPNAKELKDGAQAVFASFNQQAVCRVYAAGEFLRLEFSQGVISCFDDAYLLLANGRLACGGRVLSPLIEPLKKSKMIELLRDLERKDYPAAFIKLAKAHEAGFGLFCAQQRFNLSTKEALKIAQEHCQIVSQKGASCYSYAYLDKLKAQIKDIYKRNQFAMQSPNSLAKSLQAESYLCEIALNELSELKKEKGLYLLKSVNMKDAYVSNKERLYEAINKINPLAPYNIYDELGLDRKEGDDILKSLCMQNKAIRLAHNYFISKNALDEALNIMRAMPDGVGVQELKARLNLSRKYAISLLEYADNLKGVIKIDQKRYFKG